MTAQRKPARWDIFCRVVDNFGDAGVCWRLARQLANEHGFDVTLWIDRLETLERMVPGLHEARLAQRIGEVNIRRWTDPMPEVTPADVVVNAFVAGVPDSYVAAMAASTPVPQWIELEYLSPDPSFDRHHLQPSPHPRLPLARTFWVPGFSPASGGLLRERGLLARRDAFAFDLSAPDLFWRSAGLPAADPEVLRVSMFSYPHSPHEALAQAWAAGPREVLCVAPENDPFLAISSAATQSAFAAPQTTDLPRISGHVTVAAYAFLSPDNFDRLLWCCDVNFVRGEDSFVRALWAGKPMVWTPYLQEPDVLLGKLNAFLDLYVRGLDPIVAATYRHMTMVWNARVGGGAAARGAQTQRAAEAPEAGSEPMPTHMLEAWNAFVAVLPNLRSHAQRFAQSLAQRADLAGELVKYCANRL